MGIACLVKMSPLYTPTGERYDIHACNMNSRSVTGLGGVVWEPALVQSPTLGLSVWNGDFQSPVTPGGANFSVNIGVLKESYAYADMTAWAGAPVEIWAERDDKPWPWVHRFIGKVAGFNRSKQAIAFTCEVDAEPFKANILTATYAGTGLAEGDADLKGKVKPLVIGLARNVEPALINAVDSVYQFSAYGPIEGMVDLFERGSAFGSPTADYADYAALVAATIAPGKWATCLAQGLIRLGAPAAGVITGDLLGHEVSGATPRVTGEIIAALADIAGVDTDLLDTASLDAMDSAVPYTVNLALADQTSFLDQARAMALACNYQAGTSLLGQFFVTAIDLDRPETLLFDAQGRALPQVVSAQEAEVSAPYWRTVLGANRCWRVQSPDEIAFEAKLVDCGRYDDTRTYREGNYVDQPDGSRWLYIYATATAGNDPPTPPATSNTWWESMSPVFDATAAAYPDGTPLADLQPAESDADVTSLVTGVAEIAVSADYTGATLYGLPRSEQYRLFRNGVDVTTSATWSVSTISGTISASIGAATGLLTIDASGGTLTSSVLEITADYGTTTRTLTIKVSKVLGNPPSTGGGGTGTTADGAISGTVNSTTMTAVSDELTVTTGTGGNVDLTASFYFNTGTTSGSWDISVQWYRWNGSAYVAVGSAHSATDQFIANPWSMGYGECNETVTGLGSGTTQKFQLFAATPGGTVARNIFGSIAAVGS